MWMRTPAALVATILIAAPVNASAAPVPAPDVDPPPIAASVTPPDVIEDCTASGVCKPSIAMFDLDPAGNIADITWCDLESEHYITFTGIFVIGHWIFIVRIGMTVCWYGECGGYVTVAGGGGDAPGMG